jgi:hypothetical protein
LLIPQPRNAGALDRCDAGALERRDGGNTPSFKMLRRAVFRTRYV